MTCMDKIYEFYASINWCIKFKHTFRHFKNWKVLSQSGDLRFDWLTLRNTRFPSVQLETKLWPQGLIRGLAMRNNMYTNCLGWPHSPQRSVFPAIRMMMLYHNKTHVSAQNNTMKTHFLGTVCICIAKLL